MSDPNISLIKRVIAVTTQGRGLRGYSVIIGVSDAGMIQWRQNYTGAPWNDIIDIADLKGDKGDNSHIHIKWHSEGSEVLLDTPDTYIGIYADNTVADSETYADYQWFKWKGEKGDPGNLTGPESSVNENIPIFDGIAGDKLKDSGVKLSDKADVTDVEDALALKADITYVNYLAMGGVPA